MRLVVGCFCCLVWGLGVVAAQTTTAEIVSAEDPTVQLGTATLSDLEGGGVSVQLEIPANDVLVGGEHAVHIHETGSCTGADLDGDGSEEAAGAAGGHYNPTGVGHGDDNGPHVGDSEAYNYSFGDDGSFSGEIIFPQASLRGDNALLTESGTALVIHAGADDMTSDPAGSAGPRVACGVVTQETGGS